MHVSPSGQHRFLTVWRWVPIAGGVIFCLTLIPIFLLVHLSYGRQGTRDVVTSAAASPYHLRSLARYGSAALQVPANSLRRYRAGFVRREDKRVVPHAGVPLFSTQESHIIAPSGSDMNWSTGTRYYIVPQNPFPNTTHFTLDHPEVCAEDASAAVKGIVLVMSATDHFEKRSMLRKEYPPSRAFRRLFLVGVPVVDSTVYTVCLDRGKCTEDTSVRRRLEDEDSKYHDILMTTDFDVYQSLTLKTVAALRWVTWRCPHIPFFYKLDDDVYPNYAAMERHLDDARRQKRESWWFGTKLTWHAIRYGAKNLATTDYFPGDDLPYYASGTRYFMSMDVAHYFAAMAKRLPLLPIEDAWMGIAGHLLGLTLDEVPWNAGCDRLFTESDED